MQKTELSVQERKMHANDFYPLNVYKNGLLIDVVRASKFKVVIEPFY
jgi:hypothetical protein